MNGTPAPGDLLLTGATGFVGMEVLARYLERTDRRVTTLVRAPDDSAASGRVDEVLAELFGSRAGSYAPRVTAVAADLTARDLGLTAQRRLEIASATRDVIHAGASVSFALGLDESRAINVLGTERMLALAELAQANGGLDRFAYVSTAYVSGDHRGRFTEADLDVGQGFRNSYEQSKHEAERLVRARIGRLPVTILRPSIVVGDRRSGWTSSFNVLYAPLRAFARGMYPAVPAVPSAPVDVVSIDYVADAIFAICQGPGGLGETYHLTAGERASTVGELVEMAKSYFRRPLSVVDPDAFEREVVPRIEREGSAPQRAVLERSRIYFPYFRMAVRFDDRRARARLRRDGIRVSPLGDYFTRLVDHAVAASWGRRPIPRAQAMDR